MNQIATKKSPVMKKPEKAQVLSEQFFVFGRENYILMAVGVVIIFLGFYLMAGKDDIFNTTKLTISPIVVIIGFIIEAVAVMYKSKS